MEISQDLIGTIKEILKIMPGALLFPFSLYFFWKKIYHKVYVSFTVGHYKLSATRIESLVLSNLKDKPLPIFSIYAVIDRDISIQVQKFDPPLILKGLESLSIKTDPVSAYYIGSNEYEPEFMFPRKVEIYLVSASIIKCKNITPPSIMSFNKFSKYSLASAHTRKFNGFVYNENLSYVLIYELNGETKTAFIENSGFITNEWDLRFNMVPEILMQDSSGIDAFIKQCGYDKIFKGYNIVPKNQL